MSAKTLNISLPVELRSSIQARVRSGLYGSASDVIRAGLRALTREEMAVSVEQFDEIMSALPEEPLNPEIEQEIEQRIRSARNIERKRGK